MSAWYEPGRYRVRIVHAALGESKNSGTPQVEVTIEPHGIYTGGGQLVECAAQQRTVYLALTEGTLGTTENPGFVMQTLTAFGFVGPSFADLQPLIGKEADAQCKIEDYDGKEMEKWELWRPRTGQPQRPAEKKTVRTLDSKFSALLKSASKAGVSQSQPARTDPNPARKNGKAKSPLPVPEIPTDAPPAANASDGGESIPF